MRVVLGSIPSAGLFWRICWLVQNVYIIKNDRDIDFLKTRTFLEHIGDCARTSGPKFARTLLIDSPGHPLEFALTFGSYTQILIERDRF
jgi:hypothetical protein